MEHRSKARCSKVCGKNGGLPLVSFWCPFKPGRTGRFPYNCQAKLIDFEKQGVAQMLRMPFQDHQAFGLVPPFSCSLEFAKAKGVGGGSSRPVVSWAALHSLALLQSSSGARVTWKERDRPSNNDGVDLQCGSRIFPRSSQRSAALRVCSR